MDSQIVDYIADSRRAGMPDDLIRTNLIEQGWTREDIEVGFHVAPRAPSVHLPQTYFIAGLFAVAVVLGIGAFLTAHFRKTSNPKSEPTPAAQISPTISATPTAPPQIFTPTTNPVSPQPTSTPRPTRTPTPPLLLTDADIILAQTNTVLEFMKNKQFTSAIPYFWTGTVGQLTTNDIVTALSVIETSYRANNIFDPRTAIGKVLVLENKGQVLAECFISNTRETIRFDFARIGPDWKIENISVGQELNLSTPTSTPTPPENQYNQLFQGATFSESSTTIQLATGDTILVAKTKIADKNTDPIRFIMQQPYSAYLVLIKDVDFLAEQQNRGVPMQAVTTQDASSMYILSLSAFKGKRGVIEIYTAEEEYNGSYAWISSLKQAESLHNPPIKQIPFIID